MVYFFNGVSHSSENFLDLIGYRCEEFSEESGFKSGALHLHKIVYFNTLDTLLHRKYGSEIFNQFENFGE